MSETSDPIRIAFCITELDPGGAEQALVELVKGLDSKLFEPAVFCLGPKGDLAAELERAGIRVTCLGATRSWQFWVIFRLIRALRRFRPTILQTWLFHANLIGRLAARLAGVPIIVSGIRVAEKRSRFRLWIDRITQSWVKAHVCVSQDVADFSIERGGLNPDRVHAIPNGVNFARFANAEPADLKQFGIPSGSKTLLFVGRLDEQKDPLWLWDAFEIIQSQMADVHLIFVGRGLLESQLKKRIESSPIASRGHLLGRREDVPELLKAADILVLPSRWEGMPNIVLEAAATGTPVVTADVEGVSEILTDGVTGRIVTSRSPRDLAEAVTQLLEQTDARIRMGRLAQGIVSERFKMIDTCARYQQLYSKLIRNLPPKQARDSSDRPAGK